MNHTTSYNIAQLREENQHDTIKMYQKRIEQLKKRNEELKAKHNGLREDFQYNYQLLRERDEELDKLEKELEKKGQVIVNLSKSIQTYKQQVQTEKSLKLKHEQLLNQANEHIEIIKKEHEIKLNDLKFEYNSKLESMEKQNIQQVTQIQQLRELIDKLKQQNETEKTSNQDIAKKYESKLDEVVSKLSNVQNQFEIEKKTNKTRIDEYVKAIEQKSEHCLDLEKNVNELKKSLAAKHNEYNELYFRLKEQDKHLTEMKLELNTSNTNNMKTENVLSIKDSKIIKLESDLEEMYQIQYQINAEKQKLNQQLIASNQEIEKLTHKLVHIQENKSQIIKELTMSNENLKMENETLKQQNHEIRTVTKDMKCAITQLHELSNVDKKQNSMDLHEMQSLIAENEKLKKELHSVRNRLKDKERELAMLKREKTRLHEINNRYHHQLNHYYLDSQDESLDFTHFDEENSGRNRSRSRHGLDSEEEHELDPDADDDDHEEHDELIQTKLENDKLMKKIKDLQASLTSNSHLTTSFNTSTVSAPIPPSKHSIRMKYDQVRRRLNSGMSHNRAKLSKSMPKHPVRNWNQR